MGSKLRSSGFDINQLPPELIATVCENMNMEDLYKMVRTSSRIYEICNGILKSKRPNWTIPEYRKEHALSPEELYSGGVLPNYAFVERVTCPKLREIFKQPLYDKFGDPIYFIGLGRGFGDQRVMKDFLRAYLHQHKINKIQDDPLWESFVLNLWGKVFENNLTFFDEELSLMDKREDTELYNSYLDDIDKIQNRLTDLPAYINSIPQHIQLDIVMSGKCRDSFPQILKEEVKFYEEDKEKMKSVYLPSKRIRRLKGYNE